MQTSLAYSVQGQTLDRSRRFHYELSATVWDPAPSDLRLDDALAAYARGLSLVSGGRGGGGGAGGGGGRRAERRPRFFERGVEDGDGDDHGDGDGDDDAVSMTRSRSGGRAGSVRDPRLAGAHAGFGLPSPPSPLRTTAIGELAGLARPASSRRTGGSRLHPAVHAPPSSQKSKSRPRVRREEENDVDGISEFSWGPEDSVSQISTPTGSSRVPSSEVWSEPSRGRRRRRREGSVSGSTASVEGGGGQRRGLGGGAGGRASVIFEEEEDDERDRWADGARGWGRGGGYVTKDITPYRR